MALEYSKWAKKILAFPEGYSNWKNLLYLHSGHILSKKVNMGYFKSYALFRACISVEKQKWIFKGQTV